MIISGGWLAAEAGYCVGSRKVEWVETAILIHRGKAPMVLELGFAFSAS